ncbi:hypothetical protein QCA50_011024 [Cerrena zonata]|uniref:Uncharacterized protein n=1 Tax=Cerrena zonata TaxID=2478898 RepID=A0AAW0FWV5_9APHY
MTAIGVDSTTLGAQRLVNSLEVHLLSAQSENPETAWRLSMCRVYVVFISSQHGNYSDVGIIPMLGEQWHLRGPSMISHNGEHACLTYPFPEGLMKCARGAVMPE